MDLLFLPVQLILGLFLIFAASRVYLRFKEGKINLANFLFWSGLWLLALFSLFRPRFTTYLARILGIGRGADIIIYLSIALLFYLIFRTNVMMENLREEISRLTREIALKEGEKRERKIRGKGRKKGKR